MGHKTSVVTPGSVVCQVTVLVGLATVYVCWKPVKMSLIGEQQEHVNRD